MNYIQKKRILTFIKYTFLMVMAIIVLFPYIWMIISSFKSSSEVFDKSVIFPAEWIWQNYPNAMKSAPFGRFFINSIITSGIIIVAQLLTCSLAAFAFAKMRFRFKNAIFFVFLCSMMIPAETTTISNFVTVFNLKLTNTYMGITIVSLTSVFGIFLLRQYFMTIPDALIEAAKIDGCTDFAVFRKIFLPLAGGALATVGMFAFINSWNSYMWPMIVTSDPMMRTVQTGIRYIIDPERGIEWALVMAASTVIILPVMIIFVFLQKYFIQGITKSGIK